MPAEVDKKDYLYSGMKDNFSNFLDGMERNWFIKNTVLCRKYFVECQILGRLALILS